MRRGLALALVLLAAGVIAQPQEYPTPSTDDVCGPCHVPGNGIYSWVDPLGIAVGTPTLDGADIHLEPAIVNTWRSTLQHMSLETDLSEAPSLRFASAIPPLHVDLNDTIRMDLSSVDVDPATLAPTLGATQEQVRWQAVAVPPRATDVIIRLEPTGSSLPDLRLLINSSMEPDRTALRVDAAGPGQAEVLRLDADEAAALGVGTWRIGAGVQPADTSGSVDPQASNVPFRLRVDAWVNSTDRVLIQSIEGTLVEGQLATTPLVLVLDAEPEGEWVTFRARVTMHYDHDSGANPSDGLMMVEHRVPVTMNGTDVSFGGEVVPSVAVARSGPGMDQISEAIGYGTTFLMLGSMVSGGVFGKASRRGLNRVFGTARRRVAFHNFLSYGLLMSAISHLTLFIIEEAYHWTVGLLWGGASMVCLIGLAVTGAVQVPLIRSWGHNRWRWTHFGFAIATLVFLALHLFLDGANLGIAHLIGWDDPLVPEGR